MGSGVVVGIPGAKGTIGDIEKYNAATMLGYQVIRFSTEQVKSGLAYTANYEKMVRGIGMEVMVKVQNMLCRRLIGVNTY